MVGDALAEPGNKTWHSQRPRDGGGDDRGTWRGTGSEGWMTNPKWKLLYRPRPETLPTQPLATWPWKVSMELPTYTCKMEVALIPSAGRLWKLNEHKSHRCSKMVAASTADRTHTPRLLYRLSESSTCQSAALWEKGRNYHSLSEENDTVVVFEKNILICSIRI